MKYAFTVLALAATVLADYPTYPTYPESSSSAAPVYPVYPESSSAPAPVYPVYPVKSTSAAYPVYPVKSTSTAAGYPVKSPAPVYPVYPVYPGSNETVAYTTIVTTAITTYCPYATEVVHGGKTYTVSEATTLTITDCPCTITKPIYTPTSTPCTTTLTAAPYTYKPVAPPASETPCTTSTLVHSKYPSGVAASSGVVASSSPMPYSQANGASANKVGAIVVGAVAGVVALAL